MKYIRDSFLSWMKRFHNWLRHLVAQKWFDIGLRAKMSALVTIGLTGLLAIFAYIGIASIRQATQQLLSEHVQRAHILAGNLDSNLGQATGLLAILSTQIDMAHPQANLQNWRAVFEADFRAVQGIYLFDSNTHLVAATVPMPNVDWEQVSALQNIKAGASHSISTGGMPRPYAVIAVPVLQPHSSIPAGALAAVIDLSNPAIFLSGKSSGLEQDGILQIVNGSGKILASSQPDQTLPSGVTKSITQQLFGNGQPMAGCLGCTGNEFTDPSTGAVIAFAPLTQAPWGVLLWHEPQAVFAPIRHLAIQALVLGVLAMLGAFALVLVTTRSVIAPVQVLTNAARKVGEASFDVSTMESVECALAESLTKKNARRDEIGILSNSFITMCRRLKESMEEIHSWNQELDNRVQARTQQLSIVNAVSLTVNQSLNLEDILNRALDEVSRLAGIDLVAIFLPSAAKGQLELVAYRGLSENAARLAHQVGLLDSSCGGVMEIEKVVIVPDISPYRGRGALSLQREHVTALMHVPLTTRGWTLGSMCVGTRNNIKFGEEEQNLLTAIGGQIAIAVENARLYAEVQRKERVRGRLFKRALAAQEDERKRIARELHDEISQSLTALLYEAEGGLETDEHPENRQRLQSICDLTQRALDNIHNLIFDLRPSMLDQLGLIPALRWLAETRLQSKGIRVNVDANSEASPLDNEMDFKRLSPEIETALYRVVQEAINNIARHAAARNVEIKLELQNNTATVDIFDDGIGFDLAELGMETSEEVEGNGTFPADDMRGLGIIGMQERIELLGGVMDIHTAPGSGTQIHVRVPVQERNFTYDQSSSS